MFFFGRTWPWLCRRVPKSHELGSLLSYIALFSITFPVAEKDGISLGNVYGHPIQDPQPSLSIAMHLGYGLLLSKQITRWH
jgi:hypothetical protein